MKFLCAVCVAALLTTPCLAEMKAPVHTETGVVSGVAGRDAAITVFKGIPYAEPPVGALRWTAPQPAKAWSGVRKADHFSDGCAQIFPQGKFPKSEDCLYLNVWTPGEGGQREAAGDVLDLRRRHARGRDPGADL